MNAPKYSRADITAVIPHRPPILLIDEIEEVEFGTRGVAVGWIDADDDFVAAYLPGLGIMPRPMLIEALAQTAAFVAAGGSLVPGAGPAERPKVGYLVRLADVVFSGDARPGDTVRYSVNLVSSLGPIHKFAGVARVGDAEICRGDLTFSVQ